MCHKDANTYGVNVLCGCKNSRLHFTRCGHAASAGGTLADGSDGLRLPRSSCLPILETGEIGARPRLHGCGQHFYWSWH